VGERLFRELVSLEAKQSGAQDAALWGFPREIDADEIESSYWFRLGQDVVFWYESVPGLPGLWVHLAVSPHGRENGWGQRRWIVASEIIGELLGADRLRFVGFAGVNNVTDYLTRMGWQEDATGLHKMLGV